MVLVVEDDDQVRAVIVRTLLGLGYETLEASSGRQALDVLARPAKPIDLVLTDVVMPRMGGMALYRELRKAGSPIRVLLMSGHTAEDLDHLDDPLSGAGFLHKPWSMTDLLRRVREVLDDRSVAAA